MCTKRAFWLVALVFLAAVLLACDIASLTGLSTSGSPGAGTVPAISSPGVGQSSQEADYLKCDPNKLSFPLLPDATNCQHLDVITNFQSSQPPQQVIAIYGELLAKDGWKRKDDGSLSGIGSWVKGTDQLNIVAAVENGATAVQVQETRTVGSAAPAPTNMARGATPAPTSGVRGATPAPTDMMGHGVTPAATAIYISPDELTVKPEMEVPLPGDHVWAGMNGGDILNFCVNGNQVDMVHIVSSMSCKDKQTGQEYDYAVNISLFGQGWDVPWLIQPTRHGVPWFTGGYELTSFPYQGVTVTFNGYFQGSTGRAYVDLESDNEVATCRKSKFLVDGIPVKQSKAPCVRNP